MKSVRTIYQDELRERITINYVGGGQYQITDNRDDSNIPVHDDSCLYQYICLDNNNYNLHQILWAYYYNDVDSNHAVHHRNEKKKDNHLCNLAYMTLAEHMRLHRLLRMQRGEVGRNQYSKDLTDEQILSKRNEVLQQKMAKQLLKEEQIRARKERCEALKSAHNRITDLEQQLTAAKIEWHEHAKLSRELSARDPQRAREISYVECCRRDIEILQEQLTIAKSEWHNIKAS